MLCPFFHKAGNDIAHFTGTQRLLAVSQIAGTVTCFQYFIDGLLDGVGRVIRTQAVTQ
ncbi:hypothetical protein D3C80_2199200 [compost metagenome]